MYVIKRFGLASTIYSEYRTENRILFINFAILFLKWLRSKLLSMHFLSKKTGN